MDTNSTAGCRISSVDCETCGRFVAWFRGKGDRPGSVQDNWEWGLVHCDDGVTWGRFDPIKKAWRSSSESFPDGCPVVTPFNLIEMRLFGKNSEIMIQRNGAEFSGRWIVDLSSSDEEPPTRPEDECRILLGDRMVDRARNGFTRVGTADGSEQVVPLECTERDFSGGRWPLRLWIRHYFQKDEETGVVRVAASRLVSVEKEDARGQ